MSAPSDPLSLTPLSLSDAPPTPNGVPSPPAEAPIYPSEPLQLSIPLRNTYIPTRIHLHLTIRPSSILLFVTTKPGSSPEDQGDLVGQAQGAGETNGIGDMVAPGLEELGGVGAEMGMGVGLVDPFAPGGAGKPDEPSTVSSTELGSFVVAIPNLRDPAALPASTPLYVREQNLDTTTRIARILARKSKRPCYVGCSMDFAAAGLGGSVEEVMEGIRVVVRVVGGEVGRIEGAGESGEEEGQ
ncbi:hypothetical protein BDZ91DRAFT_693894 [Kalaharituber pfeilii]|nr:hypothetical protein BDZ91DRAFT_693894 [Kalaharituber pfeilii]